MNAINGPSRTAQYGTYPTFSPNGQMEAYFGGWNGGIPPSPRSSPNSSRKNREKNGNRSTQSEQQARHDSELRDHKKRKEEDRLRKEEDRLQEELRLLAEQRELNREKYLEETRERKRQQQIKEQVNRDLELAKEVQNSEQELLAQQQRISQLKQRKQALEEEQNQLSLQIRREDREYGEKQQHVLKEIHNLQQIRNPEENPDNKKPEDGIEDNQQQQRYPNTVEEVNGENMPGDSGPEDNLDKDVEAKGPGPEKDVVKDTALPEIISEGDQSKPKPKDGHNLRPRSKSQRQTPQAGDRATVQLSLKDVLKRKGDTTEGGTVQRAEALDQDASTFAD